MNPSIRPLDPAVDGPQVLGFVTGPEGVRPTAGFRWTPRSLQDEFQQAQSWGLFLESELVAFVCWRSVGDKGEITVLATRPSRGGQGWMAKLLQQTFNSSSQISEWWLEVHEGNQPARRLYEKLGFQQVGRRPRYYSDGAAALLLSRAGSGPRLT